MADLSGFKKGEFVSARMTVASVTKIAELFDVASNTGAARSTVSDL